MDSSKIFLLSALVIMAMAVTLTATPSYEDHRDTDETGISSGTSNSPRGGNNRILALRNPFRYVPTCDRFPRVCRWRLSPGPDCCKRRCVNLKRDWFNCGSCGKRCKFSEICCKGKCVSILFDKNNCGRCNRRCKKGRKCTYGMCNYA